MPLLDSFLHPATVSLKICGVTRPNDAETLVRLGVEALGVNFWPRSKRYLAPEAAEWLAALSGKILRVGVFVNADPKLPIRLVEQGLLDAVQLHGDETPDDAAPLRSADIPFIKAIGVKSRENLAQATDFGARALLLDAHAPGVYGGTGEAFDWTIANEFKLRHPETPILLAGGIVPENAAEAALVVHPSALDVASGAEISPGVKDIEKVKSLLAALRA
ncbi:MAG: phosphoribosylanthranilate isomerase [Luteolibacter sp.]